MTQSARSGLCRMTATEPQRSPNGREKSTAQPLRQARNQCSRRDDLRLDGLVLSVGDQLGIEHLLGVLEPSNRVRSTTAAAEAIGTEPELTWIPPERARSSSSSLTRRFSRQA